MNCVSFILLHLCASISLPAWTCVIFIHAAGAVLLSQEDSWSYTNATSEAEIMRHGVCCETIASRDSNRYAATNCQRPIEADRNKRLVHPLLALLSGTPSHSVCMSPNFCEILHGWVGFMENRVEELLQHVAALEHCSHPSEREGTACMRLMHVSRQNHLHNIPCDQHSVLEHIKQLANIWSKFHKHVTGFQAFVDHSALLRSYNVTFIYCLYVMEITLGIILQKLHQAGSMASSSMA